MKQSQISFLTLAIISFIIIGMGPNCGAIFVVPEPKPCSTELCNTLCSRVSCGNYKCTGGYCVLTKLSPNKLCLCTPRAINIAPTQMD